jgi:phospholipid/cholesterol/gamma-HCH transport system substrate-binding protein
VVAEVTKLTRHQRDRSRRPLLAMLGAVVVLAVAGAVLVAWNANRGLPFQQTTEVTVDIPSASRLIPTDEVRIAGVRVGEVKSLSAVKGTNGRPPYARVKLALSPSVGRLPADTHVSVQPASILGEQYVQLVPGRSRLEISQGRTLPLANAHPTVDLSDLLGIFDRATARDIQTTVTSLGDGLAGRGTSLNESIGALARLLPSLETVSDAAGSPSARLGRLVDSYERFINGLAPASRQLAGVMHNGAVTFGALERQHRSLGASIDDASPAERATTVALTALSRPLAGLAGLLTELRDPAGEIPPAARAATAAVSAGVRPLREIPVLADRLGGMLAALGTLSRDRATGGSLRKLSDLAAQALLTLDVLTPAQVQCNVISLFAQSFGTAYGSTGFLDGPPMAYIGLKDFGAVGESLQNATPSPGIAIDGTPTENYQRCDSGNEPYPGHYTLFNPPTHPVMIGNPGGPISNQTLDTYPPPGVHALARRIGILPVSGDKP